MMSTALTVADIPWTAADQPPIAAFEACGQTDVAAVCETDSRQVRDYRELVITDLADGEAAAEARVAELTEALDVRQREHAWTVEALRVAVGMLARATYERDRALATVYQRAGVSTGPDDGEVAA